MIRRTFAKTIAFGTPALSLLGQEQEKPTPQPYKSASPYDVGSAAQLFVDRILVRDSNRVAFTLHQAERHPANPLVKADQPWEGWRLELFGSVIWDNDDKLYKMWYLAEPVGVFGPAEKGSSHDNPTCYAISKDGIRWEKPLVGTLRADFKHNVVLFATHLASVYKDHDEPNPDKRYKMVCWIDNKKMPGGYYTMVSSDGLNWNLHGEKPICRGSDVVTAYYDKRHRMWVALAKIGTVVRGHNRRVFWVTTSHDFDHWTEPELAIYPDLMDDAGSFARIEESRSSLDVPDDFSKMRTEFYGVGFYPTESCTIGFPWVFTINNKARYGNDEGPFEIQLAVTRDFKHWDRPFRTPCVPRGKPGDWEWGIQQTASQALRVGDEIWLYYCGANYTHGSPVLYRQQGTGRKTKYTSSIGLAKWKLDRFVSADGFTDDAVLNTVPVLFDGDHLELNASTLPGGRLTVELLDASGTSVLATSTPVQGDSLRHKVRWNGAFNVADYRKKPVTLRFHLAGAELYSFAFRES